MLICLAGNTRQKKLNMLLTNIIIKDLAKGQQQQTTALKVDSANFSLLSEIKQSARQIILNNHFDQTEVSNWCSKKSTK